jgi:hypothetical protein
MANHTPGKPIAEPATGTADDINIRCPKADFLCKLPVQRLFRCFVLIDTTLGKLPGVLPYSPCPENLASVVGQNDSDVGSETV